MKRYLLAIISLLMILALSGCGSNSKVDSSSDLGSIITDIKLSEMQVSENNFNIDLTFIKEVDSSYKVTLDNFNLTVEGCRLNNLVYTPESIVLDGEKGTYAQLSVSGQFDTSCNNKVYAISALQTTVKDGKVDKRMFTAVSDQITDNESTPAPSTGFYNATTPIVITLPSTHYSIKVQVVDNGYAVSGQEVYLQAFDSQYGYVSNPVQVTGIDGFATFDYLSPSTLPDKGTSTSITLSMDRNGTHYTQNIVLEFNPERVSITSDYNLTNVTTPLVIHYDNELKTIFADVVDTHGVGIEGVEVSISAVEGREFGSIISASKVLTDSGGHASFTYKAPDDVKLVDEKSTTINVSIESNGVWISKSIDLVFDKIEVEVPVPTVVILNNYKDINLTENSQNVEMEVQVFEKGTNVHYTSGNVKVSLPGKVLDGVDVGSFTEYSVPVNNEGKAIFNYTGPQNLQALIDANDKNATFSFYHEENPTESKDITVHYELTSAYIPVSYELTTSSADGEQTMGLQSLKSFTIYLKDDQGNLVTNDQIKELTITSKNTLIGRILDVDDSGIEVDTLVLKDENATNSKSFPIKTYTISGLLPIEISVKFIDANGDEQVLPPKLMNIVVFSGPPTAMSISYAGVEQNTTTAKYIEKFVVTVTDAYNNLVNTQPYIAVGAMVEYAVDGSSSDGERSTISPRLWHGLFDTHGRIEALGDNRAQFIAENDSFKYVDFANDKLVIFGKSYVYEALGKWDIQESGTPDTLTLLDDYNGTDRTDLYFAVGHNNRQDLCRTDGVEYVGNMKASNYQLDKSGHALIEFEYDYQLTGKDIMVWVNLTGYQADTNRSGRIGEAQKHTLRGNGLVSNDSYSLDPGTIGVRTHFEVHHENAPEWYRNGHFGFSAVGCTVENIIISSNDFDARECINDSVVFVDLNVSNYGSKKCTITIENIAVSDEFNSVTYP